MRQYTKDHTWVEVVGTRARVGISDFAQSELGDIAYVELPQPGKRVLRGEVVCTVDSLKSSSEIYAPVSGVVAEVNAVLSAEDLNMFLNSVTGGPTMDSASGEQPSGRRRQRRRQHAGDVGRDSRIGEVTEVGNIDGVAHGR